LANRGKRKRRSYSTAFKRWVVAGTMEPGASVSEIARRHGLNANMVFLWRGDPGLSPRTRTETWLNSLISTNNLTEGVPNEECWVVW
jgi:hypothetical protein